MAGIQTVARLLTCCDTESEQWVASRQRETNTGLRGVRQHESLGRRGLHWTVAEVKSLIREAPCDLLKGVHPYLF